MSNKINGIKCPRCESAKSVTVHTIFRSAIWFQDPKCGHIFEIKREELARFGITESEMAKYNAIVARDM